MFQGFDNGSPSYTARRTHPGRQTWVTRKNPSQPGESLLVPSLVSTQQIIHLELSAMHELLLVALECLAVPCIFNHKLPSSFTDKVDIFVLEMVLRGFIVCLNTEGAHGDFRGRTALAPYTKKKVVSLVARLGDVLLPHSVHGSSSIHFLPCFFKSS
jgi:hypothetical protein